MSDELFQKYGIRSVTFEASYITADTYSFNRRSPTQIETTASLSISQGDLRALLHKVDEYEELSKKYYAEMYIREQNPTVQKAYEKYQMFLELARSEKNDRIN